MKKCYFFLPLLFLQVFQLFGGGIKGRIVNEQNEPIAFVSIFVSQLKTGTNTNAEGYYELILPEGEYEITFQYLGYQTVVRKVVIGKGFEEINLTLKEQVYQLKEVEVKAGKEDPAYGIMRKVIGAAPYYLRQVQRYRANVYIKGSANLSKIPKLFRKKLAKEGIKEDEQLVNETVSQIEFEQPNVYREKVIAMRSTESAGEQNPMRFVRGNIYYPDWGDVVSPLAPHAFAHYAYAYEGSFQDRGRDINKIKITPRRKGQDLLSGYLYVAEDYWHVHSADFLFDLPFGKVRVKQTFAPIAEFENVWLPVSYHLDVAVEMLGFEVSYAYVVNIKDYQITLNPTIDHTMFRPLKNSETSSTSSQATQAKNPTTSAKKDKKAEKRQKEIEELLAKEKLSKSDMVRLAKKMEEESKESSPPPSLEDRSLLLIDTLASKRDTLFWNQARTIPLTDKETQSFTKWEAKRTYEESAAYRDSVRKAERAFKFIHLFTGNTYIYREKNKRFSYNGLANGIDFNTVDGYALEGTFRYEHTPKSGKNFSASRVLRYAFARERLNAKIETSYRYQPLKMANIHFAIGRFIQDFAPDGIHRSINSFNTLFLKDNYLKLYEKDFLTLSHRIEVFNGFNLTTAVEYAKRRPLENHSSFSWGNRRREYTANVPSHPQLSDEKIGLSEIFLINIGAKFTPNQRYQIRDGVKSYKNTPSPTYEFLYRKALPQVGNANFDYVELSVRQRVKVSYNLRIEYAALAGKFLRAKNLYFADFKHFTGNLSPVYTGNVLTTFRYMDYYRNSTQEAFGCFHTDFSFNRFLFKRLPWLNMTNMDEHIFINFLRTTDMKHNHTELGYSLSQIFAFLRVDVCSRWRNTMYDGLEVRLGITFN